MQTFLPYADFAASAATLHRWHLGKQRIETYQIILGLTRLNPDGSPKTKPLSWGDHLVAKMWGGVDRLHALYDYQEAICYEWTEVRGYADTCLEKTLITIERYDPHVALECLLAPSTDLPSWLGDPEFHESYQSNLVRKMPEFYGDQFPDVGPGIPYWYLTHAV